MGALFFEIEEETVFFYLVGTPAIFLCFDIGRKPSPSQRTIYML
jgi:hypothetical protein